MAKPTSNRPKQGEQTQKQAALAQQLRTSRATEALVTESAGQVDAAEALVDVMERILVKLEEIRLELVQPGPPNA